MLTMLDDTLGPEIKQWEDTRGSLASALTNYLDSCNSLEAALYRRPRCTNTNDITPCIEKTLNSLHLDMVQQFTRSTSTLARVRNSLVSPIWSLPGEVLSEIFLHVVYDPEHQNLSTKDCLQGMYSNLHNITGVCSAWKNVTLNQCLLWVTVPACDQHIKCRAIDLSIQRSGGRGLRLATILPNSMRDPLPSHLTKVVENYTSRLRALNIEGKYLGTISDLITGMLRNGVPPQLSELSIRFMPIGYPLSEQTTDCVVYRRSPNQVTFTRLMRSLSALRLSQIQIQWESIAFSDRLVELFIHKVKLGNSEATLTTFLSAIASAKELRNLQIMDVGADRNPTASPQSFSTQRRKEIFPKLESLVLHDLPLNVLEFFLLTIAPDSRHSTLSLTAKALRIRYSNHTCDLCNLDDLTALLEPVKIDKLILSSEAPLLGACFELDGPGIRKVLGSIPSLKELEINGWTFDKNFCDSVSPSSSSGMECSKFAFPELKSLELTQAQITHEIGFKNLVANIAPSKIVLGGYMGEGSGRVGIKGDEDLVGWLKHRVPAFRLIGAEQRSDGQKAQEWKLW